MIPPLMPVIRASFLSSAIWPVARGQWYDCSVRDCRFANHCRSLLLVLDITSCQLVLNSGNLELNNHTIDLGATGHIAEERNEARITGISGGIIKATVLLNAPRSVNPGNIGVEITSAANLGLTPLQEGMCPKKRGWRNRHPALFRHTARCQLQRTGQPEVLLFRRRAQRQG